MLVMHISQEESRGKKDLKGDDDQAKDVHLVGRRGEEEVHTYIGRP